MHGERPDDRDSKHLWNVGKFLSDYTAQHPRRYLHTRHRENMQSHKIYSYFYVECRGDIDL
jgi:hypothetical protein